MTKQEAAVIMAQTGVCLMVNKDFSIFHAYAEKLMGRPIQTIEFADDDLAEELKRRSTDDFISICKNLED